MTPAARPFSASRLPSLPDTAAPVLASAERILSLILAVIFVLLSATFFWNAGGLWRDEANSVSLAGETSLVQIVHHLDADSFPLAWLLLLRAWIAPGLAANDFAVRGLGLLTALCVPAALLWHARVSRIGFPYWSFLLLGLNPVFLRCIGSTRAYGLGIVLLLLASAALWQACAGFTRRRATAAFVLSLLCVQCIYYNLIFVGAMCLGAYLVARRRGDCHAKFYAVTFLCGAVSLLPYLPVIARQHAWSALVTHSVSADGLLRVLGQALCASGSAFLGLWAVLIVASIACALRRRLSDRHLYALIVLLVSVFGFWGFLEILQYQTSPWYYAELMAMATICIDMLTADGLTPFWRIARAATLGAAVVAAFGIARCGVSVRQTGMDLAASLVQSRVRPGDLVLVSPWYYGTSFARSYHGRAAWDTVPPFAFHNYGGMEQMKRHMAEPAPLASTLRRMEQTLRGGGRVWLVGDIPFVVKGETVKAMPPAPAPRTGWNSAAYTAAWGRQAQSLLVNHAATIDVQEITAPQPINSLEAPQVEECHGWHAR